MLRGQKRPNCTSYGVSVSVAAFETDMYVARIVVVTFDVTGTVVIVKVAVLLPAATITFDGTVALALLAVRLTMIPLAGAGPVNVTAPVLATPPFTLDGFNVSADSAAARIVSVAALVMAP